MKVDLCGAMLEIIYSVVKVLLLSRILWLLRKISTHVIWLWSCAHLSEFILMKTKELINSYVEWEFEKIYLDA